MELTDKIIEVEETHAPKHVKHLHLLKQTALIWRPVARYLEAVAF